MKPLALLVLLGGCSLFAPDTSTPQSRCEAQAYDDPTVKQLNQVVAGSSNEAAQEALPKLAEAKQLATRRCLRGLGLAPLGGVEKVKPPG